MSIQLSLNGLSFCIINLDNNTVVKADQLQYYQPIALSNLPKELLNFIDQHQLDRYDYQQIIVVHNNPWFSIVPNSLFDSNYIGDYLKYTTTVLADDTPAVDHLIDFDLHMVYIPFTHVNNALLDRFSSFDFMHHGSVLIKNLYANQKKNGQDGVYAFIESHSMSLTIFKDQQLQLFNVFEINTTDELLYYLLFSLEQVQLDPENCTVALFGSVKEGNQQHTRIAEFIKNINFFIPDSQLNFEETIKAEQIELLSLIAE